jgi:hypothetical protein
VSVWVELVNLYALQMRGSKAALYELEDPAIVLFLYQKSHRVTRVQPGISGLNIRLNWEDFIRCRRIRPTKRSSQAICIES